MWEKTHLMTIKVQEEMKKDEFNQESRQMKCKSSAGHIPVRAFTRTSETFTLLHCGLPFTTAEIQNSKTNTKETHPMANKPRFSDEIASAQASNFQEAESNACTEIPWAITCLRELH